MSNLNSGQNGDVLVMKRVDAPSSSYCAPWLPGSQPGTDGSQLIEYLAIIRGHIVLILALALSGIAGGALISLLSAPKYRARTTLDIQQVHQDILNGKPSTNPNDGAPEESYIQTEIKILESDSMVRRATDRLKKEPPRTEGGKESPVESWSRGLGSQAPQKPAHDVALEGISVKVRSLGMTRIVEVLCDARDGRVAAAFCNTMADEYIAQNSEARWQSTQQTGEWLSHQLEDLKHRLARSEEQLTESAKETTGALALAEDPSLAQDKLRQLQNELSNARAERVTKQLLFEMAMSSPANAAAALTDGPAREYQVKLTDFRRQLAELSITVTPAHYKVQQVQSQIKVLESALEQESAAVIDRLQKEYKVAQRREALLNAEYKSQIGSLSDQAAKAVQYNMLKREVESGRDLYQNILRRVEELSLMSAMRASTIRVVDRAVVPTVPYTPNWRIDTAVGFFGGTLVGVVMAFVQYRSNRSLQAPGDAAALLNVRELGVIPSAHADKRSLFAKRRFALPPLFSFSDRKHFARPDVPILYQQHSLLGESFSAVMNSLLFTSCNDGSTPLKVIVIASPESGDGKTTIASNLAVALSQIGRRVLLVDGDLRSAQLSRLFKMSDSLGLVELLTKVYISEPKACFPTANHVPQVSLLPSGNIRSFETKLLHSVALQHLMRVIRSEFDIVLIDSPPMVHFSDARVLGRCADGVLLVFRSGKTTLEVAIATQRFFVGDGTHVIGTILNDWNPRRSAHFRSYGCRYYDT